MVNGRQQKQCFEFGAVMVLGLVLFIGISLLHTKLTLAATVLGQTPPMLSDMTIWQAAALGIIQGLTEFVPISSTAHLKVIPAALGWNDPGVAYTAVIQLGSIAAVLGYFWQDLTQVFTGTWQAWQKKDFASQDWKIFTGIALGTVPIVVAGLALKVLVPDFDNSPMRSLTAIAIASIVMSLLLALAEKIGLYERNFEKLTLKDGILMGLAQMMALIPGVSRSGSTITAGLFIGLDRATAARFSFLLGIPAITLAGLVELKDILQVDWQAELMPLGVGLLFSTIFSYLAIAWFIKYLQNHKTWFFVWYRLAFGIIILGFTFFK